MTPLRIKFIALSASGKSRVFDLIEIEDRFCLTAGSWGINLQGERSARERGKAFRNRAPVAAAIPNWRANPGLYSSRAVGVLWPRHPATSPFSCAISLPASRPNSLMALSPAVTVMASGRKSVFTYTQKEKFVQVLTCVLNNGC